MSLNYTTAQHLPEFCILNKRPDNSKQSLWAMFNYWYRLLSVSLVICIFCYRISCPECPLRTPQQKVSSSFLSEPPPHQLQTLPMESLIIGISCYRYLLLCVSLAIAFPAQNAPYPHRTKSLFEFSVSNHRHISSSHSPWDIVNHWYLLLSVSLVIGIS